MSRRVAEVRAVDGKRRKRRFAAVVLLSIDSDHSGVDSQEEGLRSTAAAAIRHVVSARR